MGELVNFNPNKQDKLEGIKLDNGRLPDYAWPGGYPMFYITKGNIDICPECANKEQENVINYDANWEDPEMYCGDCGKRIPSAYAEDEVEGEE